MLFWRQAYCERRTAHQLYELNCSRSHLIRKSLKRDLRYVLEHEVVEAAQLRQKASEGYRSWLDAERKNVQQQPTVKKPRIKGFKEWLEGGADGKAQTSSRAGFKQHVVSNLRTLITKRRARSTTKTD